MSHTPFNAVVKKISEDRRLSIPTKVAEEFNLNHSIYVVKSDDKIMLTQKCNKRNSSKIVNTLNANANGIIQFSTNKYFNKNTSNVVIYKSSKDTITVKSI